MRRLFASILVLLFALQPTTATASVRAIGVPNIQPVIAAIQQGWLLAASTWSPRAATAPTPIFDIKTLPKPLAPLPAKYISRGGSATQLSPGLHVSGPPMLTHMVNPAPSYRNAPQMRIVSGIPHGVRTLSPGARQAAAVNLSGTNATGINPWWTYEEGSIPGIGKWMANVANGNLLVQADDVDIPERGIDIAFRRTYNSMSGRDWNNDDGSIGPGMYGAGWTNTFDAHLAPNSGGGVSVFDIDGARYDYGQPYTYPAPGTYCLSSLTAGITTRCALMVATAISG